ncbi:hypothetical protein MVEN_00292800 [Mycena venus]|uniref:Jacalin-type lectin domain-containing protein n=1 Tax=Mycena venus TaxID=2733690 RepID=A0A8H6Z5G4_9AGAR|nr:hypothetical protein MVEN_00292800 [Mycena venus]
MPFHTRTTTIAATATSNAIRVYTQSGDGDLREGCHDQDVNNIGRDQNSLLQADGWFHGALHGSCDPGSTLCCITWGSGNFTIFYQTHDNVIHEMRHDGRDWHVSNFVQAAMPGTDMGEVHSQNGDRVMFFFQDKEGFLCYRRASNWQWDGSVRLCKAASTTAITATTWSETKDIRVYYQDENNMGRECAGSFDGGWVVGGGSPFASTKIRSSMAAISWPGPQIRVYMQDYSNSLIEWCWIPGSGWKRGGFTAPALPDADIAAFYRTSRSGGFIHVYWTSYEKILHQKVWTESAAAGWLPETPIGYLSSSGALAGSMSGNYFTDNDTGVDHKIIRKVIVKSGSIVDGLQFQFADGTFTPWRGGKGGVQQEFALQDKEDITQVLVCSNGAVIQKLSFITSNGRQSIWFGIDGQHPDVWEFEGKALAGFSGTTGQYVNGLQALWSERQSSVGPVILNQLVAEAQGIATDISTSGMRNAVLIGEVDGLSKELSTNLHGPAENAVAGVIALAHSVEDLSKATGTAADALVAKCKGQSVVVSKRFEDLHTKAHDILDKATKLATDITYQEATTQSKIKRVGEMLQISQSMRANEENVWRMRVSRIEDAKGHIADAMKTLSDAQHKKDEAKKARVVRDIFTFGLGELGDWGGLNEAISYADSLIKSANANLASCQEGLAKAQTGVNAIKEELNRFTQLKNSLDGFGPVLQSQANSMNVMTKRIQDLENHALDTGVFLSGLAGKASVLGVQHTAKAARCECARYRKPGGDGNQTHRRPGGQS